MLKESGIKLNNEITQGSENLKTYARVIDDVDEGLTPNEMIELQKLDQMVEKKLGQVIEKENEAALKNETDEGESGQDEFVADILELVASFMHKIENPEARNATEEDKIVDEYAELMDRSVEIGKSGGVFFNFLAKHSFWKPVKDYEYVEPDSQLPDFTKIRIEGAKRLKWLHEFRSEEEELKAVKEYFDSRFNHAPSRFEEAKRSDYTQETYQNRIWQMGGENIIEELVVNYLFDDANIPESSLYVHNKKSGHSIDLSQLLPSKDYVFMPADMWVVKSEPVKVGEELKTVNKCVPTSLKDYQGGFFRPSDNFYLNPFFKRVAYGDLKKKGGLLSILHEIAHAWQSVYHDAGSRFKWDDFYKKAIDLLGSLDMIKVLKKDDDKQELWDSLFANKKNELAELGVEIDEDFIYSGQVTGDGVYKLIDKEVKNRTDISLIPYEFHVRSDKIKPLLDEYVKEERNAWAHAIRILRYFRKMGIDLEPELKTSEDFEEIIHYALGTYQQSLDQRIGPVNDMKEFTNKSKFSSRWPRENVD